MLVGCNWLWGLGWGVRNAVVDFMGTLAYIFVVGFNVNLVRIRSLGFRWCLAVLFVVVWCLGVFLWVVWLFYVPFLSYLGV